MIYINGVGMPSPSELSVQIDDVGDDSRRNALGNRVVDRLAVKRTLTLKWPQLDAQDTANLLDAVTQDVFFELKYADPMTGAQREGVFRATSRSVDMFRADGTDAVWASLAMKWEEK